MKNINYIDWYHADFKDIKLKEWRSLLSQNLLEHDYHKYLSDNAGIFLSNHECHLAISKLKLGSELETDFITLTDGYSNGNIFELIELKQPTAKLFTDKGVTTSEFNRAIQQIRDWKRWLMDNRNWMSKYLPTVNTKILRPTHIKFKIIIGRRLSNQYDIEKRNQIADEIGAEIRSFDYLTDKLKRRDFYPTAWLPSEVDISYEKELANPFYKAFTDSEWKEFCNSQKISTFHFYGNHFEDVLKRRKYNL
ncbi:DUF4263 domain-containing protein [Elizabethkingia anophelis]|nr:DUF4263 domain-containing protein [Elizabethkingia anophelis]